MTEFISKEREFYRKRATPDLLQLESQGAPRVYEALQQPLVSGPLRAAYWAWLRAVQSLTLSSSVKMLDYCCGYGHHAITLQKTLPHIKIVGIDIASESLQIGKRMAEALLSGSFPDFIEMDAHHLNFEENTFDLVSDFGSLSSLDFDHALSEIHRVLKPGGHFVALETFGHNPFTNLRRRWNVLVGKRTAWAGEHILQSPELLSIRKKFLLVDFQYFGLMTLSYGVLPFKSVSLLSILERVDQFLFKAVPGLKKYAFKVLCIARK